MKQKQNLMDMRDEKIASAAENGQDIKRDLDEYEKQLSELDKQIAQLQREPQEDVKNAEDNISMEDKSGAVAYFTKDNKGLSKEETS